MFLQLTTVNLARYPQTTNISTDPLYRNDSISHSMILASDYKIGGDNYLGLYIWKKLVDGACSFFLVCNRKIIITKKIAGWIEVEIDALLVLVAMLVDLCWEAYVVL